MVARAHRLRELHRGRRITPMPRSRQAFGFGRVNLLKKVHVGGEWKFCPAVVEAGRRLNDLVRVNGQIETHYEGTYYLDWREQGKRRRQPVRNRALVFEQARLKALELEAQRNRGETASTPANLRIPVDRAPETAPQNPASAAFSSNLLPAAHLVWKGIEAYVQEMIGAAVRSQLASLGTIPRDAPATGEPRTTGEAAPAFNSNSNAQAQNELPFSSPLASPNGTVLLAQAIESYLKDVEPPQREQKTYDEYRLVLYKFRDSCSKHYLHEINRDDCLSFMRHLYSLGNEARTVFNRMGIVLQLLKLHGIEKLLTKRDKPKFVKNVREMYQPEDLAALFKACMEDEKVLYLFFLLTGERDKEVRHTAWPDVDFVRSCVRVTAKKQLGFKPKDKERKRNSCALIPAQRAAGIQSATVRAQSAQPAIPHGWRQAG